VTGTRLSATDLAADHELSDIAEGFRFLLDLTPVNLGEASAQFFTDGRQPVFRYRPLEDDAEVLLERLDAVAVDDIHDPILSDILRAKRRELELQLRMLECRDSGAFLPLSIDLYGEVSPGLRADADEILTRVPVTEGDGGPWLDAESFARAAQAELDRYRAFAPDLESHVELRTGSGGVMVSNGDVLIDPMLRVPQSRVEALLHHEIGVHVVTHVNGRHQPLHILSTGLAGHDETQEGLAVLAEHLVGGLTGRRLRQLAARVVAVAEMIAGRTFAQVHGHLVDCGLAAGAAFTVTARVFRSGGLTKDAVYLRGLRRLVAHVATGGGLEVLWLGKLPLEAAPLFERMHQQGVLVDPLLRPRFLDEPLVQQRLADAHRVSSLDALIGDST
jgi:uncharacterized protein (TIGR02421 family)